MKMVVGMAQQVIALARAISYKRRLEDTASRVWRGSLCHFQKPRLFGEYPDGLMGRSQVVRQRVLIP